MLAYIIRRLIATIPVMGVVALFVFSLLYLAPGDPAAIIAGDLATADDIARIHRQLGLDEPFLLRFFSWLWGVLQGDLGISIFTNLPVAKLIGQRLEPTVALTLTTLVATLAFAIPLGVVAAWRAGTAIDRAVMLLAVAGFSIPSFVLAYILILVFSVQLDLLPVQGYVSIGDGFVPFIRHLILPSIALGLIYGALIARITRASMLEVLSQDYIRTAQAKGLGTGTVLIRHALRNAAVPVATVIGIGIALLISGVIVTETVFAIPGIGRLTVDAILRRDYPIIQGVTLLFSAAYVLVNLAVDISYTLLDPRVRY
jgi:peptide/nickel transport system permease protein